MRRTLISLILATFCAAAYAEETIKATNEATNEADNRESDEIPLAIDGYCAVSFVEPSLWTKGEEKFEVIYAGLRYLFLSEEEKLMFQASPEKYAIAYGGRDVVAMGEPVVPDGEKHQKVLRKGPHLGRHKDRTYQFSTHENLMTFIHQPDSYVQKAKAMEELEARIRKHEQKRGKTIAELYPALEAN